MKCEHCGTEPLEVYGHIDKTFEGEFDDEGNLSTQTSSEEIITLTCRNCDNDLQLSMIKNWC